MTAGDPRFPAVLGLDPAPPAVLFVRGDLAVLDARRVGIVGTRNATMAGRQTASDLGYDLAAAGVAVVSGLARGIDGAAHRGALEAGELASAGRPWPSSATVPTGRTRSSTPTCGARSAPAACSCRNGRRAPPPEAFRFPMRNRILAALCEVLVVVESRERGGSLLTVREALDRSVEVMAVPGSPRNRAAAGTNGLLRDGAAPVTSADDVLVSLGLDTRRQGAAAFDPRPALRGVDRDVVEQCRADPRTLDDVASSFGLALCEAAMTLARLERAGWLREVGGWFEAIWSRSELR